MREHYGHPQREQHMAYQVLARKCRPQRFSEIVGQEHITRTLQNAIQQQRVGHAYLFVGSRGIGKTTSARIFAKALNCEAGIVAEPCCQCQSCREIAAGTSLDVIEIDGASHNKVEHIRDIRDNVQYTPARSRYKIYIIDEVHMLTTQAWNALLKTLEEPPPHVKFFFATTEPHKVLPTIVSRCQRFDLKRLSVKMIAGRLREIADGEKVPIDDGALVAIARAADGGMRDAQSIFDQIIAFCGGTASAVITEEDVIDVFGLASGRELATLAVAMLGDQTAAALGIVRDLANRGRDLERFYSDLVMYVRNVMIAQVCGESSDILDVSQSEYDELAAIARQSPPRLVQRVLECLVGEEGRLRMALNKRVYLEVALTKVMGEVHSVKLDDIIARLNQIRGVEGLALEAAQKTPAPVIALPERPPREARPSPRPKTEPAPPPAQPVAAALPETPAVPETKPEPPPPPAAIPAKPAPSGTPPQAKKAAKPEAGPPAGAGGTGNMPTAEQSPGPPPAAAGETDMAPGGDMAVYEEMPGEDDIPPWEVEPGTEDASVSAADVASAIAGRAAKPAAAAPPEDPEAAAILAKLIKGFRMRPENAFLVACLEALVPVSFGDGVLELAYTGRMPAEQVAELQKKEVAAGLDAALGAVVGGSARVLFKAWVEGVSELDRRKRLVSSPEVMERVRENPFVQKTLDLFGGEIIDVRG